MTGSVVAARSVAAPGTGTNLSRRRLLCSALALAATVSAANLLLRPLSSTEFELVDAVTSERGPQWWFAVTGGLSTGTTYLALGLVVCLTVTGRGAAWATTGAAATSLGSLLFAAGFASFGAVNWYLTQTSVSGDAFGAYRDDPARVFGTQAVGFGLATIGTLVLAGALWRSGTVARWSPTVIVVTLALMIGVGGSGRLYDVLYAAHMAALVVLAVLLWPRRASS